MAPWVLLEEVDMPPQEVRQVIQAHPVLLIMEADTAREAATWFRNRVGLSTRQVRVEDIIHIIGQLNPLPLLRQAPGK